MKILEYNNKDFFKYLKKHLVKRYSKVDKMFIVHNAQIKRALKNILFYRQKQYDLSDLIANRIQSNDE